MSTLLGKRLKNLKPQGSAARIGRRPKLVKSRPFKKMLPLFGVSAAIVLGHSYQIKEANIVLTNHSSKSIRIKCF